MVPVEVHGLLAEAITGDPKRLRTLVVNCESPHPLAFVQSLPATLLEQVEKHLGVGGGAEPDSVALELPSQLQVVVELSVVDQRSRPVPERLVGAWIEIDDAEPRVKELYVPPIPSPPRATPVAVGTSMAHQLESMRSPNWVQLALTHVAGYTAHQVDCAFSPSLSQGQSGIRKPSICQTPSRLVQTSGLRKLSAISKKRSRVIPR